MTDDNLDDTQKKWYCPKCDSESNKLICDCSVGTVQIKNCPLEIANDIWNEAIEAAAQAADGEGDYNPSSYYVDAIRKLKK
jgi:hypothetical protein